MTETEKPTEQRSEEPKINVGRGLRFGYGVLILTAFVLFFPARHSMHFGAVATTLVHLLVGVLVLLPSVLYLRRVSNKRRLLAFLVLAFTGLSLLITAARGNSTANAAILRNVHIVVGFGATLYFGLKGFAQHFRNRTPQTAVLASVMLLGIVGVAVAAGTFDYPAESYYRDLTATNAQQAQNPLFPAGTRLAPNSGTVEKAAQNWREQTPEYCGRNGCHARQYNEWLHSAHSSAANDPFYLPVKAEFAKRKEERNAQYCAGCHAPEKALAPLPHADNAATNGVDCLSCHAATHSANSGNGRLTFVLRETYPYAEATSGTKRWLHDFLMRIRPLPHQYALKQTELASKPELCAGCHRQSFSVAQNGYQWVRTADTFGEWQTGVASGRAARTPALSPQAAKVCQDCHFPKVQGHTSHLSPGANTALAAINFDDEQQARIETFLKQERITLDIFSLRRVQKQRGQSQEWIAPLDKPHNSVPIRAGEKYTLEIVVTNRGVGHRFPSGYTDLRDAVLEVTISDTAGKTLFQNREHRYRSVPLDKDGNALSHHELDRQVTLASTRSIPAGGSEVVRYSVTFPKTTRGTLQVRARLKYRHLREDFARWALGRSLDIPETILAAAQADIMLDNALPVKIAQGTERTAMALRFARYANGLLLPTERPDLSNAQRAFAVAQSLAPDRPEPYLGMGRVYLREPLLLNARAQFEQVLIRVPNDPAATAELATVFLRQAEYNEAIRLLKPLAESFPYDAALQFDLGTALFRNGQFEEATHRFKQSLAADPENSAAHFQLMLSYQRLRRGADKRREEAIGLYLASDPLNAERKNKYVSRNSDAYRAAQPIPTYELKSN